MKKREIRQLYLEKRKTLSEQEVTLWSQNITAKVLQNLTVEQHYIHLFASLKKQVEVDTYPLVEALWKRDKKPVVPKIISTHQLVHYQWNPQTKMTVNAWGIPEPEAGEKILPEQLDVVLVPLLAIDQQGQRVGYGKGFYDRFLAACNSNVLKIGLGFFPPIKKIVDVAATDIGLDVYLTQDGQWKFNS